MKVLELAGVTFGFDSNLAIECKDEMCLFERKDQPECIYSYRVIEAALPPMPDSKPVYQNELRCVYQNGGVMRTYHRLPHGVWGFCMEETAQERILYVIPEKVHYLKNIWNAFDKVDFSSRLLEHGAVMLHSSYLIYDGQAILFTAASGVGKSTQAELWRKTLGAEVINGDRSIIREKDGRLWAFGTPFSGSSGICKNVSAPIRAIVTLEQALENTVRTLTRRECTRFFLAQTTILRWKPEDVIGAIELWDSFITKVPVLRLACRPDEDAVYTLKNYLDALDKEEKPL